MPPPVAILRIGLDQAARSPAATAESLNFTHFGSKDVSTEDGPSKVSGRSARSRMRADASAFLSELLRCRRESVFLVYKGNDQRLLIVTGFPDPTWKDAAHV